MRGQALGGWRVVLGRVLATALLVVTLTVALSWTLHLLLGSPAPIPFGLIVAACFLPAIVALGLLLTE